MFCNWGCIPLLRELMHVYNYHTVQSNGQTAVQASKAVLLYICRRRKHNWRTVSIHLFLTYPNCVRVNQCYRFIFNIQRSMLTNFWPCASFTSCEFWHYPMTCSNFILKSQKLILSHDNKSFYQTICKRQHFVIKYFKPYLKNAFLLKLYGV
jgi:hypothetical protein